MKLDSRTIVCTSAALAAFAGNSVLSRLALGRAMINAASFSTLRLAAGTAMLLAVLAFTQSGSSAFKGSWTSGLVMFLYSIPFSFAYTSLTAGTGALILFGAVQLTMMVAALRIGERPHWSQWIGLVLASSGLVYLVLPGLQAPPLTGSALMAIAGIAWGVYSLRGRGAANPLQLTTNNFVRALPLSMVVSLAAWNRMNVSSGGLVIALACGAITSGLGYVLWYIALRHLTATRAAVLQLMVPVLAGVGGVVFLGETVSARLVVSGATVLGGIALTLSGGRRFG